MEQLASKSLSILERNCQLLHLIIPNKVRKILENIAENGIHVADNDEAKEILKIFISQLQKKIYEKIYAKKGSHTTEQKDSTVDKEISTVWIGPKINNQSLKFMLKEKQSNPDIRYILWTCMDENNEPMINKEQVAALKEVGIEIQDINKEFEKEIDGCNHQLFHILQYIMDAEKQRGRYSYAAATAKILLYHTRNGVVKDSEAQFFYRDASYEELFQEIARNKMNEKFIIGVKNKNENDNFLMTKFLVTTPNHEATIQMVKFFVIEYLSGSYEKRSNNFSLMKKAIMKNDDISKVIKDKKLTVDDDNIKSILNQLFFLLSFEDLIKHKNIEELKAMIDSYIEKKIEETKYYCNMATSNPDQRTELLEEFKKKFDVGYGDALQIIMDDTTLSQKYNGLSN